MYGEVDKIKLGKTSFPNCRYILYIICTVKKNPHGSAVDFIVFNSAFIHLFGRL